MLPLPPSPAALTALTAAILSPEHDLEATLVKVLDGEEEPDTDLAFRDRSRVRKAARLAASLIPPERPILGHAPGPASGWVRRTAAPRRAAYALAAARRLAVRDLDVETERRYLAQHIAAERARQEAAARVDSMAARYGPVLGWVAKRDAITSPGCAAADRSNFIASRPPVVEGSPNLPGTLHGGACRCVAGPPWPGGRMLSRV